MVTLILVALAIPDLRKTAADPAPIAYIATYWLGPVVSRLFLVAVVYSVFALIVVSIAAVGRTFFALSRDNVLPASTLLARVNPRSQTPVPAIVLSTVLMAVVMVFAAVKGEAFLILIASTPILVFMNNLIVVVAYWWRRERVLSIPSEFSLGRWAVPVFVLAIIWLVGVLADLTIPPDFRPAAVTAVGIWGLAVASDPPFIPRPGHPGEGATGPRALRGLRGAPAPPPPPRG